MSQGDGSRRSFWRLSGSPELILRLLLGALFLSTCVGVWFAVGNREAFVAAFPGAGDPVVFRALLAVAAAGVLAVVGLWTWRRWGVALYGVVVVASIILDVVADAPAAHQATVLLGALCVGTCIYLTRGRFWGTPPSP